MKGIVFTEFFEMVEQAHGYEMVDQLIIDNDLPSGGIYTTIGTYGREEIVTLVLDLSRKTKTPIPILLNTFGKYLFEALQKIYPSFFYRTTNAFDFIEFIEKHIHLEVKKRYPEVKLPGFKTKRIGENTLEMTCHTDNRIADFIIGLIEKAFDHYQEKVSIDKEYFLGYRAEVKFFIKKI